MNNFEKLTLAFGDTLARAETAEMRVKTLETENEQLRAAVEDLAGLLPNNLHPRMLQSTREVFESLASESEGAADE